MKVLLVVADGLTSSSSCVSVCGDEPGRPEREGQGRGELDRSSAGPPRSISHPSQRKSRLTHGT